MVRACRKTKSKRLTCSKKYKIIRKVKEHHRKIKQDMKKNPKKFKHKDPGVPNILPFKEDIIKHVQETKKKFDEVRKLNLMQLKPTVAVPKITQHKPAEVSFHREFNKVINEADVLLEVLDARDPIGTRCLEAEREIKSRQKKLVIILNKIDLVPRSNAKAWLEYLRKGNTVLPFKANTQEQTKNLGQCKMKWDHELHGTKKGVKSSKSLGVDGLMSLLANYCRNFLVKTKANAGGAEASRDGTVGTKKSKGGDKTVPRLKVGVIGLPNTGKSAIVNTLKRQKVAASSNQAGLTKQCQMFLLDHNICLLDSPGIVMSRSIDECELMLRNCLRPESVEDLTPAVEAILRRCPKRQLTIHYGLPASGFESTADFLVQLARRMGRMRKGGRPHLQQAARSLVKDWITGRITYCTVPPTDGAAGVAFSDLPFENDVTVDELDFPLQEFDSKALAGVPDYKPDEMFCPMAELQPSEPFSIATLQGPDAVVLKKRAKMADKVASNGFGDLEEEADDGDLAEDADDSDDDDDDDEEDDDDDNNDDEEMEDDDSEKEEENGKDVVDMS